MIINNVVLPNFKLTYRRLRNRFLFYLPLNEKYVSKRIIISIMAVIFIVFTFLVYNVLDLLLQFIAQETLIALVNLFTLWIFLRGVIATTDILNKVSHPEDYHLLYSLKTDPRHTIMIRFLSIVFYKGSRGIFILTPVWLLGSVKVNGHLSLTSFLVLIIFVMIFSIFQIGFLSIYATTIYIITTYYLKIALESVIKGFIHIGFIVLASCLSTVFLVWVGQNYISGNNPLELLVDIVENPKIEILLNKNTIPTNWIFNSLVYNQHPLSILTFQMTLFLFGLITLFATLFIIMKFLKIYDMSKPNVINYRITTKIGIMDRMFLFFEGYLPKGVLSIMKKDVKAFRRASFIIKRRLVVASYLMATEFGSCIGLAICHQFFDLPVLIILPPLMFVIILNISFLGDAILGITSADAERENLLLYKGSSTLLYQLISAKVIMHLLPIGFVINLILFFILFVLQLNIFIALPVLFVVNSFGVVLGLSQVIGTFLYPRLDWEHMDDIGSSIKSSLFQHTILGTVLMLYLQLTGIISVLYWKGFMNTTLICTTGISISVIILIGFLLFYYLWIKRIGTINWEVG